jgi:hypothetical protein
VPREGGAAEMATTMVTGVLENLGLGLSGPSSGPAGEMTAREQEAWDMVQRLEGEVKLLREALGKETSDVKRERERERWIYLICIHVYIYIMFTWYGATCFHFPTDLYPFTTYILTLANNNNNNIYNNNINNNNNNINNNNNNINNINNNNINNK